jgi:Domain of unknown function (DUF1929)
LCWEEEVAGNPGKKQDMCEFGAYRIAEDQSWEYEKIVSFDSELQKNEAYAGYHCSAVLLPILPDSEFNPGADARILFANEPTPYLLSVYNKKIYPAGHRDPALQYKKRHFACSTLLPTGEVFINGGIDLLLNKQSDARAVYEAEIYDPDINWKVPGGKYRGRHGFWKRHKKKYNAQVPRNYHSVALLLPDGSVWTAGSSKDGDLGDPKYKAELSVEIFYPSYCSKPGRLEIRNIRRCNGALLDAQKQIAFKDEYFTILTDDPARVQRVALIRFGSSTHAANFDQRYVSLLFEKTANAVTAKFENIDANIAPPGWYLCWLIDDRGLPCKTAHFIHLIN